MVYPKLEAMSQLEYDVQPSLVPKCMLGVGSACIDNRGFSPYQSHDARAYTNMFSFYFANFSKKGSFTKVDILEGTFDDKSRKQLNEYKLLSNYL